MTQDGGRERGTHCTHATLLWYPEYLIRLQLAGGVCVFEVGSSGLGWRLDEVVEACINSSRLVTVTGLPLVPLQQCLQLYQVQL